MPAGPCPVNGYVQMEALSSSNQQHMGELQASQQQAHLVVSRSGDVIWL